jgi:hypothetical protein
MEHMLHQKQPIKKQEVVLYALDRVVKQRLQIVNI